MPKTILTIVALLLGLVVGATGASLLRAPDPTQSSTSPTPSTPSEQHTPAPPSTTEVMTQPGLVELIRSVDPETEGDSSVLRFTYQNTLMACISDTNANRMRIVAPIMSADELTDGHRQDMMIASYHLTLDVRYAEGDGVLYAIYLHPLDSFTEPELLNALPQLAALVANFGTSYASTPLLFGVPSEDNAPDPTPNPTVL